MEKKNIIERYLLLKPVIKGYIEIGIIVTAGILCAVFDFWRISVFRVINITGIILLAAALLFHYYCERYHKNAHKETKDINKLVITGVYSIIRHPIYLSLIITNIGTALVFNAWISLIIGLVFSTSWVLTVIKEEKQLIFKFGKEYKEYMDKVRWRIIPGIF